MTLLNNYRDLPELVKKRREQTDPWVMYLVVRSDIEVLHSVRLRAAASATMKCVALYEHHPLWAESFSSWFHESYRKVTLRAKGSRWRALQQYDRAEIEYQGEPILCVLPPRRKSQCDSLIRSLQAFSNPVTNDSEIDENEIHPAAMTFVFNPNATMSAGKQIAQLSHAVLLCARSVWREDSRYQAHFDQWQQAQYPSHFLPPSQWDLQKQTADGVIVTDGGLTEIEPGTETVIAVAPGALAR